MESIVVFRSPLEAWEDNWTFVVLQLIYAVLAWATFRHAWCQGWSATLLWLSAVGHGLWVEGFCYAVPSLDNFHHGRAVVSLFGGRMPLYVVILYPAFYYTAAQLATSLLAATGSASPLPELRGGCSPPQAPSPPSLPRGSVAPTRGRSSSASRSSVRRRAVKADPQESARFPAEPRSADPNSEAADVRPSSLLLTAATTGLVTAVVDIAYDVLGPKLLHWSWHVDDPNVFERAGPFVPVTSYVFHITFAASWLVAGVLAWRYLISPSRGVLQRGALVALGAVLACTLPFAMGAMQIQLVYVIPHDLFCVPTTTCLAIVAGGYFAFVLFAAARARSQTPHGRVLLSSPMSENSRRLRVLFSTLQWFALAFVAMGLLADPSTLRDTGGVHQPLGVGEKQCHENTAMVTLGGVVNKSTFLCVSDRAEETPARDGGRLFSVVPGSRDRFGSSLSALDDRQCRMHEEALPFHAVVPKGSSVSSLAGSKSWTMQGTPWGHEGAASSQPAMLLAVVISATVVTALAEIARAQEGAASYADVLL